MRNTQQRERRIRPFLKSISHSNKSKSTSDIRIIPSEFNSQAKFTDENNPAARLRIGKFLEEHPTPNDIALCTKPAQAGASEATNIWACASCGRIILHTDLERVYFKSLKDIGASVELSDKEIETLYRDTPEEIVRSSRQCKVDPRKSKYSVAAGHDYGRVGQLPALNDVSLACISPARLELSLSEEHSTGNAICFPLNGPCELARVLPNIDDACTPRVTFIGSLETWRIRRKLYLRLFDIPVDDVYEWLHALPGLNNIYKEKGIEVVYTPERRRLLRDIEASIKKNVHIADSAVASELDEETASEFGELEWANYSRDTKSCSPKHLLASRITFFSLL
ncbi:unnamed protein product [Phytophthora lilii]|uniref:Unnamed protein product n=1 Tax=Phytophthora lilii TaxID=2077276 RepID=A0A9W6X9P3_9STRA|nr:unnamed protein product [Phytophthora lilii]